MGHGESDRDIMTHFNITITTTWAGVRLFDFYLSHVLVWAVVCEIEFSQMGKNSGNII